MIPFFVSPIALPSPVIRRCLAESSSFVVSLFSMAPLAALAKVAFSSSSASLIKKIPTSIYKSTLPLLHPLHTRLIHLESSPSSHPVSHLGHEWMSPSVSEQNKVTGNSNESDAFGSQDELRRTSQRVSAVETKDLQDDFGLGEEEKSPFEQDGGNGDRNLTEAVKPCVLEILNLPERLEISDLYDIFKPFGTVLSVEVRNLSLFALQYRITPNGRKRFIEFKFSFF